MQLCFDRLIDCLRASGAEVIAVDVPNLELAVQAYTPLVRAEAAYVHRAALTDESAGFSQAVRKALEAGLSMSAIDYLDAFTLRARVVDGFRQAFRYSIVDALLLPTTPSAPLLRGETDVLLEGGRLPHREAQLALTAPLSLAGVPVAAIPCGHIEGLPVGCQLATPWHQDAQVLNIGAWAENCIT
jgi:aspartyl-tRNA(Asn)/glutamyl-tRNA(Gln) amidotransferase subunit A